MIIKNGKSVGFVFHNDRSVKYKYNKNRLFFIRGWKVSTGSVVVKCINGNNVNDGMRLETIGDPVESYTIIGNTVQTYDYATQPLLENPINSVGNRSKAIVNYHINLPMSEPLTVLNRECSGITIRIKLHNVVCKSYQNPDSGNALHNGVDLRDSHIIKMWQNDDNYGITCGLCGGYQSDRYYFPPTQAKRFNLDYSVYVDETVRKIEFMLGNNIIANSSGTCDIEISYGMRDRFYRKADKSYIQISTEYNNLIKPKIISETTTTLSDNYSCITKLNGDIVIHRTDNGDDPTSLQFSIPTLYGLNKNKLKLNKGNYFIYALPCGSSANNTITNYFYRMHIFDKDSNKIGTFIPTPSRQSYLLQMVDNSEIDIVIEFNTAYKNVGDIVVRPIVMKFNPTDSIINKYNMVAPIFNDIELEEPLAKIGDYVDSLSSANGESIYKIAKVEYVVDENGDIKRKEDGVLYNCFSDDFIEYTTSSGVPIVGIKDSTHGTYIDTDDSVLCNYFKPSTSIEINDSTISGETAQEVSLTGIGRTVSLNQPTGVNNVETPILDYTVFGKTTELNGVGDKTYNILPSSDIVDTDHAVTNNGLSITCDGFGNYHISGTLAGTASELSLSLMGSVTIPDSIQNNGHGCLYIINDIDQNSTVAVSLKLGTDLDVIQIDGQSHSDIYDDYVSDETGIGGKTVDSITFNVSGEIGDSVDFNIQVMVTNISTDVFNEDNTVQDYHTREYKPHGFEIPIHYNVTDKTYYVFTRYELKDDMFVNYKNSAVMRTDDGVSSIVDIAIVPHIDVTKSNINYLEVLTENEPSAISVEFLSSVFEYICFDTQSSYQQYIYIYSHYFAGKTKADFINWIKKCYNDLKPLTIYMVRENNYIVPTNTPQLKTLFSMNNKYHAEVSRYRFDVSVNPTVNMTYNSFLERK